MSQGIIRLKKVKVGQKRNLSIIKTTVFKKQLSVRFEDQIPIETIKTLSQDIDQLTSIINRNFPSKPYESPSIKPTSLQELIKSANPNDTESPSPLHLCHHCRQNSYKNLDSSSSSTSRAENLQKFHKASRSEYSTSISDFKDNNENAGNSINVKRNIESPCDPYKLDVKIVKKGRIYRPDQRILHKSQQIEETHKEEISLLKIIKQSRPFNKDPKRKKFGKDILIMH